MEKKIEVGMQVYCDLHSKSKKHTVTELRESLGWAKIDGKFLWPLWDCYPCETTKLPDCD